MVENDRVAAALPSYEIGSELGRGACGVVLAGRHRQLGRLVAIKQLPRAFGADPGVRARFLAEARVLATLDHPHVVSIYDFVDHEGLCLLVMERLTGGTVWSRFHAGGFTPDVSCAILLAVNAGLHHAHQHGILHRDVKPENLMFSGEGSLKVTDLGIAKVIGGSSTLATRHGEILGTPAYIAPEQAQGRELTPATDVYAAGTLLYELLAGRLPFPTDTDPATLVYRHVHEVPPPLLEVAHAVPADLCAVVDRAISKAPADRYQSAEEFGVAIAQCAASTWGRGWLSRTNVPVSASGPILAAALGEAEPGDRRVAPTAVESPQPTNELQDPVAGDFLPIQLLHPEYREGDAPAAGTVPEVAAHAAPPTIPPVPAAPPTVTPAAPARETIVDPVGPRGAADGSDAGGSPPPPTPSPGGAGFGGQGDGAPKRSRRVLLIGVVAVVVVGALIAGGLAIAGGGSSKPKASASHPGTVAPATSPAVTTSASWTSLPSAPTARQQVGSAVSNGTLWVLGGLTSGGASTAKVEGYDPATQKWTTGPDLPVRLHHLMAVAYRGQLVAMGGWIPSGGDVEGIISKRVFSLQSGKWVELPPMLQPRAAGAAAVVGNDIIVAGGQANHALVTDTEMFDGTKWTEIAPLPTPRDHLAAVSDGRYFYAIGGRKLSADANSGAFERYDPTTNKWQELPALPTPRGGLAATFVGNQIVTAGGESPTGVFNEVEAYNLSTSKWSALPPLKDPRHGLALLSVGNTIDAIDGAAAPGHTHSTDTNEALVLASSSAATQSSWKVWPSAPIAAQQVGYAPLNGTLWVLGGLATEGTATAKVEGYDPVIQTWTSGPDLPVPLHHLMAVTYRGELVVMGGWSPSGGDIEGTVSNRVFALENGKWVALPPMLQPRAAGAAAVIGDKIVVAGGQANHKLVTDTEMFDGSKWTEIAPLPTPRDHLAGVSDGHAFYAIGGRMLSSDKNSSAFERYDPVTNKWQALPPLPTARGGLAATLVGGQIVTVGGESPTGLFNNVEAYNLSSNTWTTLTPMKTPRHGLALFTVRNTIYAIDGALAPGHTHSSNINESLKLH